MTTGENNPQPLDWPHYDEDEIAAVTDVLRSGSVNQWTGTRVRAFEDAFAARCAMPHAVAVANGSLALELALHAFGIGSGDEVIVTSTSFVASASCVSLVGATPVFADVERDSQNISAHTVEPLITARTRAVIPVHLAGHPVDMDPLMALAGDRGLVVIEDCAQAHGAAINGKPVGSFGHAAAFSFCQDKILSTGGEGGMTLFREAEAMERAWSYKDHGKSREKMQAGSDSPGFRYVHDGIGSNWRLTEMQAAIGLAQLDKLDAWLERRRVNARVWADALGQSPAVRIPQAPAGATHACYRFRAFLKPKRLKDGATRDDVLAALQQADIDAAAGFCPEIYREAAFAHLEVAPRPAARELGQTSLAFKVHPTLDPDRLTADAQRAREIIADFER
jgi:dTDP-4-amino-4,6-dideoxygalactose transaminase